MILDFALLGKRSVVDAEDKPRKQILIWRNVVGGGDRENVLDIDRESKREKERDTGTLQIERVLSCGNCNCSAQHLSLSMKPRGIGTECSSMMDSFRGGQRAFRQVFNARCTEIFLS